jgi:hypothetical protein
VYPCEDPAVHAAIVELMLADEENEWCYRKCSKKSFARHLVTTQWTLRDKPPLVGCIVTIDDPAPRMYSAVATLEGEKVTSYFSFDGIGITPAGDNRRTNGVLDLEGAERQDAETWADYRYVWGKAGGYYLKKMTIRK